MSASTGLNREGRVGFSRLSARNFLIVSAMLDLMKEEGLGD